MPGPLVSVCEGDGRSRPAPRPRTGPSKRPSVRSADPPARRRTPVRPGGARRSGAPSGGRRADPGGPSPNSFPVLPAEASTSGRPVAAGGASAAPSEVARIDRGTASRKSMRASNKRPVAGSRRSAASRMGVPRSDTSSRSKYARLIASRVGSSSIWASTSAETARKTVRAIAAMAAAPAADPRARVVIVSTDVPRAGRDHSKTVSATTSMFGPARRRARIVHAWSPMTRPSNRSPSSNERWNALPVAEA